MAGLERADAVEYGDASGLTSIRSLIDAAGMTDSQVRSHILRLGREATIRHLLRLSGGKVSTSRNRQRSRGVARDPRVALAELKARRAAWEREGR